MEVITAAKLGGGTTIFTTRVIPDFNSKVIDLQSLAEHDMNKMLNLWGVDDEQIYPRSMLKERVGSHALSIRMVAGYLKLHPNKKIQDFVGANILNEIQDEGDVRKENKAKRTLEYYWHQLPDNFKLFMVKFSLLRTSSTMELIERTSLSLVGGWQEILESLLERRLIMLESDGTLTAHPLVKEFFATKSSKSELFKAHMEFSSYFSSLVTDEQAKCFEDAASLVEATYHAGKAESWLKFHILFDQRLNNGVQRHLGDVLGAWDDFLQLALMGQSQSDSSLIKKERPSYYFSAAAYAFKKLGKFAASFHQHALAAQKAFGSGDLEQEWARQINNCATVSVTLGRLDIAADCLELNAVGLKTIIPAFN
jgi:hypothetical protein